jgi:hypothetical protein
MPACAVQVAAFKGKLLWIKTSGGAWPAAGWTAAPPVLATFLIRAKNWVINLTLGSVSRQLTANLEG